MKLKSNNILHILAVSLTLLTFFDLSAQERQPCPLDIKGKANTEVGIYVRELGSGDVVCDVNSNRLFVPASVTKALTTATATSLMPGDARWTTNVMITGPVRDSVLRGNIEIQAVGDPTLESSHFKPNLGFADSIAVNLRRLGVKRVDGTIKVTYTPSLEEKVPAGWMSEDLIWPYGTAHHALNYRDNRMTLNLATGKTDPPTCNLKIVRGGKKQVSKSRDSNAINIGAGAKGRLAVAMPDPTDAVKCEIAEALDDSGIEILNGQVADSGNQQLLYRHLSPAMSDVMRSLMFRSDNMMAEGTLRLVAPGKSRKSAAQRELSYWNARGINTDGIYIEDGSGLSRHDRMSPRFLADVLSHMVQGRNADRYISLFPKAGREGTMRGFMKDSPLYGTLAAKTGSMRGVQCFAGYILDERGKPTHVVVMVNGFTCDRGALKKSIGNYLIENVINKDKHE